ncbi:hypothetical protein EHZ19_25065 [Paraburkholderia bannensis]|nr:hypothetical protein [Paraburkholderia bannensis]RQM45241.1 hypothetical protein EHZ19_25065 [Paraburkholderia bannensis]
MSDLKTLRAELGDVNDVLADTRAREVSAVLDRLREDVALLGSPNRKSAVRWAMIGRRANGSRITRSMRRNRGGRATIRTPRAARPG